MHPTRHLLHRSFTMKTCSACQLSQPYSNYYKDKAGRDGFKARCKSCIKRYEERNREHIKAYKAAYHEKNREAVHVAQREWYVANADYAKAKAKQYRRDNPEKVSHGERHRTHKRRARMKYTVPQRWRKSAETPNRCYWCGGDISEYHEIDHIMPISLGGPVKDYNEVRACQDCNGAKWNKHPLVWIADQFDKSTNGGYD